MSFQQHYQETHARLHEVGQRLLDYVRELRWAHWNPTQDAESFASIQADIQRALTALREQRYQVAAIAAIKAGKSTLLNALIGADVLASESEACTVCRTDVRPIPADQRPRLWEYREGSRVPVELAAGDAATIRQQFLDRTHAIRATGNRDRTLRFELEHPIDALSQFPALTGLTLVDTPGPNEWSGAGFDTAALKETALAALRTCDAILFLLDYTSFKDRTNAELLQELIEQRREFFVGQRGRLYFLLNKIDCYAEGDRPLEEVIADLQELLQTAGIPEPQIYPISAWQGLLAKLIASDRATETHRKNFQRFFSGRYVRETEEGDLIVPSPQKIAPQAWLDSAVPQIEEIVMRAVVANSGWNLLRDVLAKLEKAAAASEDVLSTRISGWQIEIAPLRQRLEAYKQLAKAAIVQIRGVKKSVDRQERQLVAQFKREIRDFGERAKLTLQREFERCWQARWGEAVVLGPVNDDPWTSPAELSDDRAALPVPDTLAASLQRSLQDCDINRDRPFQLRCDSRTAIERVKQDINRYCSIAIKHWWAEARDQLSRQGTQIRQELAADIRDRVQQISDELSTYLGEALDISLNINPIQMLMFDFQGIDTQVQHQTENYLRWKKEHRKAFCRDYEVDIQVDERRDYYQIDMQQTLKAIAREIDAQTVGSLTVVEKTVKRQVADDFSNAEQQINDYINRFLVEFERLLREREQRETEVEEIVTRLTASKDELSLLQGDLAAIATDLASWQPRQYPEDEPSPLEGVPARE